MCPFLFSFHHFQLPELRLHKESYILLCSQHAFVRIRCACTCDVQLLFVRVVMCAVEAIAHICMQWVTCTLYVLYCSVHI